jgi:hypothetical protein
MLYGGSRLGPVEGHEVEPPARRIFIGLCVVANLWLYVQVLALAWALGFGGNADFSLCVCCRCVEW